MRQVLRKVGVPEASFTILCGWFQDVLPSAPIGRIALLHIDADWYDSVRVALEQLFDKVEAGGFVVLDDFGYWEGCRRACADFLAARRLRVQLTEVGESAYFQKAAAAPDAAPEAPPGPDPPTQR